MNFDQMAQQANAAVIEHINRSAGQHVRAMKASWPKRPERLPNIRQTWPELPDCMSVWYASPEPLTLTDKVSLVALVTMSACASYALAVYLAGAL